MLLFTTPRLLAAGLIALAFAVMMMAPQAVAPVHAAITDVRFNEIENNPSPDWVELINTGATTVDVGGLIFKDNNDLNIYVIPSGTTIAAGGYLVLEETLNFSFGLSSTGDSVRLFMSNGTTLIDSHTWTTTTPVTMHRCPNATGTFVDAAVATKGAANNCSSPIKINEIENNPSPDWVELLNTGGSSVNVGGWILKDNNDSNTYTIPSGTTIASGAYLVLEETVNFTFGLSGSGDSVRLFAADGTTIIDSHTWTTTSAVTMHRCPNGTGAFTDSTVATKGGPNSCGSTPPPPTTVKINEVESNQTPSAPDFVELINTGATPVDIGGLKFKDSNDSNVYTIPTGTTIAAGGYFVLEENTHFSFGLGNPDSARLFAADGTTLVDSVAWTDHAVTTIGRCPNGTGPFVTTTGATKGATNSCQSGVAATAWPGDPGITIADGLNVLGGNMSGLTYEGSGSAAPGVLWAVKNGPGTLYRLVWTGSIWTPDLAWSGLGGKTLRYNATPGDPDDPDAEGVTYAGGGSAAGIYVATERNNGNNGVSKLAVLLFNPNTPGSELIASREWDLTANLPAVGPNLGFEAITWIPDAFLTSKGFFDESKGRAYNPADYPNHGAGLFFLGVEGTGLVYAYALNHTDSSFQKIATIITSFVGVMGLEFDRELQNFWVVCDDNCQGRSLLMQIDGGGRFAITNVYERPAGFTTNLNNEGFAVASQTECVNNRKPAYWSDDTAATGNAIGKGSVPCNDPDLDGIWDHLDNCDFAPNPGQQDRDRDGKGDACDTDGLIPAACAGMNLVAVFQGGPGNDNLIGTPFADLILGGSGNDTIDAKDGDNCIDGAQGGDTITAGTGNDVILAGEGNNVINAGDGNNKVTSGHGLDRITTGGGNDQINDAGGNNTIDSGGGNDTITTGVGGNNTINAGEGGDTITVGNGLNTINCGPGVDTVTKGAGLNTNVGGACETF